MPESQVITTLLDELAKHLPPDELVDYRQRAATAATSSGAEWRRALACAKWATNVASLPAHSGFAAEAKKAWEIVKQVEKTIGGELTDLLQVPANFYQVSPSFEAEITWVYEALHVAERVAGDSSWDAVPWRDLLDRVIAIPAT
jgi:hypothetical protein